MTYFIIVIYLIGLRITELIIANVNEKYQKQKGAIEIKDPYYRHIVITHTLFFVFLLIESYVVHSWERDVSFFIFITFILLQIFRFWCIYSLGKFWNTKVIILPNTKLITKGPYKWIKHPNYLVVGLEFFIIPILFHAYLTALIFVGLHLWLMSKRIPLENKALQQNITK